MKPLAEWTDDELRSYFIFSKDVAEVVAELIRRAVWHAEIDADMGNGILAEIRETLAAVGCSHGPDTHASTPPMMYPEWIRCCLKHAVAEEAERCRMECDDAIQQVAADDPDWGDNPHSAGFVRGLNHAMRRIRRLPT